MNGGEGWTAGLALVVAFAHLPLSVSVWWLRRTRKPVTPADRVTLVRALGASVLLALTLLAAVDAIPPRSWWFVVVAVPTLLLDAVDGAVARRAGTASELGARFDQELDAGVVLILSLAAALTLGPWVLVIGTLRYVYAAAALVKPRLAAPLPRSDVRRVVAGCQGAALTLTLAPAVPTAWAAGMVGAALGLLLGSFGGQAVAALRATTEAVNPASRDPRP